VSKKKKRVNVKGTYREIIRDSKGRIKSAKKWSPIKNSASKSRHDRAVERLSKKYGGHHRQKGTDILRGGRTIEVAVSESDLYQSIDQLRRSRAQKKYIAVPSELMKKTLKLTKGTGLGVMNTQGRIMKRTRKKMSVI